MGTGSVQDVIRNCVDFSFVYHLYISYLAHHVDNETAQPMIVKQFVAKTLMSHCDVTCLYISLNNIE